MNSSASTMPDPFEVYALRYASVARRSAENFIGGDPHETGEPLDYFVWLARSSTQTFVIDTGFNAVVAAKRGRVLLRCPATALSLLGVDAGQVEDVVVTHLHYDH